MLVSNFEVGDNDFAHFSVIFLVSLFTDIPENHTGTFEILCFYLLKKNSCSRIDRGAPIWVFNNIPITNISATKLLIPIPISFITFVIYT